MKRLHASASNTKTGKKISEKNRRDQMKSLCAELYRLLPNDISTGFCPLPDKLGEAINHIKSMEKKLENYKEWKQKLLFGKRPCSSTSSESNNSSKLTNVEVQEIGPDATVILISGMEEQASFYGIIPRLHEEGFEVVNANFSNNGTSMLQVVHQKVGASTSGSETTAVSKRLKELIHGYSQGEVESNLDLWDFGIEPDLLTSDFLGPFTTDNFCLLQQH
ncbi:transcription factor bHLH162-like [Coffea eugenioides]|uniref:transcription factor bHLH162-like n=1 Tax=Coffea eugenioides TaxID=49369 RepID=UPI000F60C3C9|nr:transcription factor bHLH162-like [Coffea eugenioides]